MSNTAMKTAETTTQSNKGKKADKPYMVLLKWKGCGLLTIPLSSGMMLCYPGYNTMLNTDMEECYKLCRDLFLDNKMSLYGEEPIEGDDNTVKFNETVTLQKMTTKNYEKVIKETVNPKALDDLSNPEWISNTYVAQVKVLVKEKRKEISEYEGFVPNVPDTEDIN